MKRQQLGKFVIADPKICHGQLTFKGTRVLVAVVLEMAAEGLSWNGIEEQWDHSVSRDAISESVRFPSELIV
ncbi:MAG: DUF433 domain-containing protein [Chitinophagales bacterium]|nr:DUF433 domain-containing protein [Chitinophagales bacterium]